MRERESLGSNNKTLTWVAFFLQINNLDEQTVLNPGVNFYMNY